MACITISDLRPAGADFFFDTENYMSDLMDEELAAINGGISFPSTIYPVVVAARASSVACAEAAGLVVGGIISYVTTR